MLEQNMMTRRTAAAAEATIKDDSFFIAKMI
jgi:hypothetical protein